MTRKVRAHTNIALIKYWGKKDNELKIPTNSSVSLTLDSFYTETSVTYDETLTEDEFYLDGIKVDDKVSKRVKDYMNTLRVRYTLPSYARIESNNNVPKEAGLASSASAFAALAKAATLHLNLDDATLSKLARLGSGSASRSIYGGFVRWERGHDHETSVASPLDLKPWKNFTMIVCLINEGIKPFSSSYAMDITSSTSPYFDAWTQSSEEDSLTMVNAIKEQDIWKVGTLAQTNALKMHASLLAVNKWYFEPKTVEIMNTVRELQKEIPVFFTMDAGPNVKLITLDEHVQTILEALPGEMKTVVCHSGPGVYEV